MQSHVIPSIIETRSQIETWWQMPELQRTQTPGCGPTRRFQAKSACLYQFFSAENCSYTLPSFSVITVEMKRIKYQVGLHDGSTKLWMDLFTPSRRELGIHSFILANSWMKCHAHLLFAKFLLHAVGYGWVRVSDFILITVQILISDNFVTVDYSFAAL